MKKEEIWNLDLNLEIDNIKIWEFFQPLLILNTLPKPFLNFKEIQENKQRNLLESLKTGVYINLLKKYINRNEKKKIKIRQKSLILNNREKILFLTYSNHINKEIARLQSIIDQIPNSFILVTDLLSNKPNKKLKEYEHTIYEYCSQETQNKSKTLAKKIHKNYSSNLKFLKRELDFLFSQDFLEITFLYYEASKELLKKENIKAVVITADTGILDRALIAAAKKLNIPIILIHHGNPGTVPIQPYIKVCVKGTKFKENLLKIGFPEKNIVLTGDLNFDELIKYQKDIKKERPLVILATSPLVDDNFMDKSTYFKKIDEIIGEVKKCNTDIIIKIHPREKYIEEYKKLGIEVTQEKGNEFLYTLLNKADLLIFFGSAIATEAIALNTKVLYIDLFGKDNPYIQIYKNSQSVKEISSREDITKKIKELLSAKIENREEFIEQFCYKLDGQAAKRIIEVINSSNNDGTANTE